MTGIDSAAERKKVMLNLYLSHFSDLEVPNNNEHDLDLITPFFLLKHLNPGDRGLNKIILFICLFGS